MFSTNRHNDFCSSGPRHHFFGFHDLVAWNADESRIACLEVEDINHIPLPGQEAIVGYLNADSYDFVPVAATRGFNFPQGARQQWLGTSNSMVVNDQVDEDWGCCLYDTTTRECLQKLSSPAHVISPDTGAVFGVNYARLFRLGAYGYNGLQDRYAAETCPANDGIYINHLRRNKPELLVSIGDVARTEQRPGAERFTHYLTHLVMNPSATRIAFLHRYRHGEGETTRLMTVSPDGSNLRCLASGFLSHFDWQDDDHVLIWGRIGSTIERLRASRMYTILSPTVLRYAKKAVRLCMPGLVSRTRGFHWHVLQDADEPTNSTIGEGVLTEDGHPMFCPANRDWIVCDHYPDADGIRPLFLYQVSTNRRIDIGKYRMSDVRLDARLTRQASAGVSREAIRMLGYRALTFTRSGLHCDLHPRWDRNGKRVAFDSIHEGTRQLYVRVVEHFVETDVRSHARAVSREGNVEPPQVER